MKKLILFLDRVKNKIRREYRMYIFKAKTGCKVNLVGNVTLINTNLRIGKNVTFYPNVMLYGDGLIEIGDNVDLGNNTVIYASRAGGVKIGSNTMIAANCYLTDTDHGIAGGSLMRNQSTIAEISTIGEDVWLSAGCTILKGSHIGNGAVIGAMSMVKGTVPENAVCVGVPAKVLRYRN